MPYFLRPLTIRAHCPVASHGRDLIGSRFVFVAKVEMMIFGRVKKAESRDKQPLIAVVDDETDLCLLLQTSLEARGYVVATANDGEEGLSLIRERRPSLVVLDFKMPKMNGYQVLAQMQKDPQLAPTPV